MKFLMLISLLTTAWANDVPKACEKICHDQRGRLCRICQKAHRRDEAQPSVPVEGQDTEGDSGKVSVTDTTGKGR